MWWFSRKRHLDEDFPPDRFRAADWAAWLATARWQPADSNGFRGMVITTAQDDGEFAFEMPAAWVVNDTLPPLLRDILAQLNDIDNIVQRACRERASRHKRGSHAYDALLFYPPEALYVSAGGVPYLDYTAVRVNASFCPYLHRSGTRWLPFYDEAGSRPIHS